MHERECRLELKVTHFVAAKHQSMMPEKWKPVFAKDHAPPKS